VFKLTIEDDEGKTTVVPLARDEMTIGRMEGNTIRLTERNVSRRHARLVRQNGALFIEDLSSFTGVRVNGAKIASPTALREGDEVQIGDYRLALRGDNKTAATPPPMTDRATMPSMPAALGPMATVGGSVAIPTRASVAAMAAQPPQVQTAQPPQAQTAQPPQAQTAQPPQAQTAQPPQPLVGSPQPPQPLVGSPQPLAGPAPPVPAAAPQPPSPPPLVARKSAPQPAHNGESAPRAPSLAGPEPAPVFAPAHTPAPIPVLSPPGSVPASTETPAPEVSEAQPTIPIRTLGEASPAGPPARVFAVTTELAGLEFALDRASLVIGRTDENDIVLNHRSISRHHAKIVRDGDQYTIVDLQSANGVRVNGEDYERIELNPGDVIELGHVKLRFVGPNEKFAFDARAAGGGRRVPMKFLAGGAVVALGVLVVAASVWYRVSRGKSAGPVVASAAPPPAAVLPPPPPAPVAPPAEPAAELTPTELLAEAKDAAGAEDWDKARAALDKLGPTVADPALKRDALALRHKVDTERQAALTFAQFDEAASANNHLEAVAKYQEIPADSLYKRRAKPRYEESRAQVVAEHLAAAEKARAAGRCAEVKGEADEIIKLDPRNMVVREMVRLCRARPEPAAPVAARPARPRPTTALIADNRTDTRRTDAPARKPEPEPRPEPSRAAATDSDGADADALMKQAREAWLKQQCGSAVDLSRKALHAKPGMTDAYQIIAVCSCTLKDGEAAGRAYAKLEDKSRNLVRSLCQKNGITLGE
jgi:pSer/pThr/pTyr-binding forkhead associated (FHA) protein